LIWLIILVDIASPATSSTALLMRLLVDSCCITVEVLRALVCWAACAVKAARFVFTESIIDHWTNEAKGHLIYSDSCCLINRPVILNPSCPIIPTHFLKPHTSRPFLTFRQFVEDRNKAKVLLFINQCDGE
jgi:hypothetical protein